MADSQATDRIGSWSDVPYTEEEADTPRALAAVMLWRRRYTDEQIYTACAQRFGLVGRPHAKSPTGHRLTREDIRRWRRRLNNGRFRRFGRPPQEITETIS